LIDVKLFFSVIIKSETLRLIAKQKQQMIGVLANPNRVSIPSIQSRAKTFFF